MVVEENDELGADMHHRHLLVRNRRQIELGFLIEAEINGDRLLAARLHDRYNFERSVSLNGDTIRLCDPNALVHQCLLRPWGPAAQKIKKSLS